MARPRLEIDVDLVEKLAVIHCTNTEIAAVVGCGEATIRRRFGGIVTKGREQGKMTLRRKQYEAAMGGNITMMIWLGKQILHQSDKAEVKQDQRQIVIMQDDERPNGKDDRNANPEADEIAARRGQGTVENRIAGDGPDRASPMPIAS